jgi:hypothetical protein
MEPTLLHKEGGIPTAREGKEQLPTYTSGVNNSVLSVDMEVLRVSESMTITLENFSAMAVRLFYLGLTCPAMAFGQTAGHWSVTYCFCLLVWASPY